MEIWLIMNAKELLLLNFEEVRRRSIKIWKSISEEDLFWRPDAEAMSCFEMIRHVLEGENTYHHIILNRGVPGSYTSPLKGNPYTTMEDELKNAQPYREKFLKMINSLTAEDLEEEFVTGKEIKQHRKLANYLWRVAYHESVHTGQLLGYLRTLNAPGAVIWD